MSSFKLQQSPAVTLLSLLLLLLLLLLLPVLLLLLLLLQSSCHLLQSAAPALPVSNSQRRWLLFVGGPLHCPVGQQLPAPPLLPEDTCEFAAGAAAACAAACLLLLVLLLILCRRSKCRGH